MSVCIVVTGSPVGGFDHIGLFKNEPEAVAFADDHCEEDWWVVALQHPDAYSGEPSSTEPKKKKKKQRLRAKLAAAQAKIDELMLEYCPDEMTEKQLKVWGDNQRVAEIGNVHVRLRNSLDEIFGKPPGQYADLIRELRKGVGDTGAMINTAAHVNAVMWEASSAIELLRDAEKRARDDYMQACSTIARMHAAAIGRIDGPEVSVIDDVAKVRENMLLLRRLLVSTYADLVEMHVQHGGFLFKSPVVEQAIKDTEDKA